MFSHVMVGSNDIERSRKFYDATFAAIGGQPGTTDAAGRLVYRYNGGTFMVSRPIDGQPATYGNGSTCGIVMDDRAQADAWHAAGVANGGTAIEDPPGVRHSPTGAPYYLAYLRDPDGNKLCALHRVPGEDA